ncbi:hypothetical protein S7711_00909 [Stachybotrys chartarum IBT 7711]|uniref:WLM domain-containing protein n=1 Tax=Stachybotrys chartarum (strain CBS 109288 / IBT 7711) TaxID=1280523 RepID=A0A084B0K8_STACB|nr:hypothetical protein S7711_00909 [Stachybotrys chartarum IBT 7711]KFA50186.1 hypothetical protein S40293_03709 [Stachybotrys chartarum IBT 40293]
MPWGVQRLNAKRSQPNPNIVFIKPLKGQDEAIAQDFLERIAAQCLPVMRDDHLYVMSLEEYEPNREFVGRNFNAGEVIQLVLKSPRTGRWLPFDYVQMVMMHELAHCKQMNHSRAFWAVRNQYATQMQGLWAKSYTGEGIWGRGINLGTAAWERHAVSPDEVLAEHLCGGTFRSRRRKRKAKPTLTYQERKEKRILKKFGKNGVALGADDETKVKLEKGKRVQGKPRVAGSARGRELRAAAALARFEEQKEDKISDVKAESETESGSGSDYEDGDLQGGKEEAARDINGTLMTDKEGRSMVKVCEDEAADDPEASNELRELQSMLQKRQVRVKAEPTDDVQPTTARKRDAGTSAATKDNPQSTTSREAISTRMKHEEATEDGFLERRQIKPEPTDDTGIPLSLPERPADAAADDHDEDVSREDASRTTTPQMDLSQPLAGAKTRCTACSYENAPLTVTCGVCANVLDAAASPGAWQCTRSSCSGGSYWNSGDCGVCGLCGQRKDAVQTCR